jgi:predicted short-subunit dehydrogenase-like oxidoreductase (DUF2520 family)
MPARLRLRIWIHGAGKVGRALAHALKWCGARVTLRSARAGLPKKPIAADLVILAVRDRDLATTAAALAPFVAESSVCVHVAGAVGPEVLEPLREVCAGVAQMHPMISFASTDFFPTLSRGNVRVAGDPRAVRIARKVATALGMTPRPLPQLDTIGYHAAAGLVANGAAALSAMGAQLLEAAGVPRSEAPRLLGPLLRSVAENVEELGFPDALTGPVRRGDPTAIEKHAAILRERLPAALPLFLASGLAQLPLARALADAPAEQFDAIQAFLEAQK